MVVKSYFNEDDDTDCDLINHIKLVDDDDDNDDGEDEDDDKDDGDDRDHLHLDDLLNLIKLDEDADADDQSNDNDGDDMDNDNHDDDDHLHLDDLLNLIKLVGGKELFHHEAFVARAVPLAEYIIRWWMTMNLYNDDSAKTHLKRFW